MERSSFSISGKTVKEIQTTNPLTKMEAEAEYKTTGSAEDSFETICDKAAMECYGVPYSFLSESQKVALTKSIAILFASSTSIK